jgi:arylsulfatase A
VPDTKAYDDQVTWTPDMKAYASQYTLLDTYVGQIIDKLDEHGLTDDTLVLFTGDNGPTPNEHLLVGSGACADVETQSPDSALADYLWNTNGGLRAGKHSLYDGGIRVPLIAWGPGVVAADPEKVADRPWGSVDLLPTLADFAGINAPSDVDGVSVRDWITGKRRGRIDHPPLYFERPPAGDQNLDGGPPSQLVYTTAIRWGRWKAVRHAPGSDPLIPDSRAVFELYDLGSDPAEQVNVAGLNPDVAERLQKRMRASHAPPPYHRKAYRPRRTGGEFLT